MSLLQRGFFCVYVDLGCDIFYNGSDFLIYLWTRIGLLPVFSSLYGQMLGWAFSGQRMSNLLELFGNMIIRHTVHIFNFCILFKSHEAYMSSFQPDLSNYHWLENYQMYDIYSIIAIFYDKE